jgi:DNA-directed RNA polymerase specialized sigma24 family protein
MHPITERSFKRLVSALVNDLPITEKVILSLYYCEELTIPEIASAMGMEVPEVQKTYIKAVGTCLGSKHQKCV